MLAVARAIASDPAVLLLDELSMGLAPVIVEELYEVVARIASEGVTVLVVEQFARMALNARRVSPPFNSTKPARSPLITCWSN